MQQLLLFDKTDATYRLIDYTSYLATPWQSSIPSNNDLRDNIRDWPTTKLNDLDLINHILTGGIFTIVSIDNIPFSEWSIRYPEYFI